MTVVAAPPPPPPILGMCRKREPHFQPWISVPEHIIFTNYQKIRSGASPFYTFWRILPFRRPSFSKFLEFQPVHRLPRAAAQRVRQRRGLAAVPEIRIFKRSAAPRVSGRSGAPNFQAQNGWSSFRRPPFSRSTGSSFWCPRHFFTLPRHMPTKIWGEYPPPP